MDDPCKITIKDSSLLLLQAKWVSPLTQVVGTKIYQMIPKVSDSEVSVVSGSTLIYGVVADANRKTLFCILEYGGTRSFL